MPDLRGYLFNSDYSMPYLVYKRTVQFTVSDSAWYLDTSINHGLPFTPLLLGQWSTSANFSPAYDLNVEIPDFNSIRPARALLMGADSSKIYISMTNNSGTNVTFYLRLVALAPPDYTGDITNIYEDSTKFKFSSDFNYQKTVAAGRVASTSATIRHGLGYIPQCRLWDTSAMPFSGSLVNALRPMRCQKNVNTPTGDSYTGARLTDSELILSNVGAPAYYVIYGDAA